MSEHQPDPPVSAPRIPTWVKWVGGALGVLLILYVGTALLLRALLDPRALAEWAEPRVEAALNRPVELDRVGLAFFPRFGVDVTGVQVLNLPEFGGPPLLEVERVRLNVAIRPLFRRRIEVGQVRIHDPVLRLRVDEDGRNNFGEFAPEGEEPREAREAGPPVDLAIRSIRMDGGRLEYESVPDSLRVVVRDVGLQAALELLRDGSWSVSSSTRAPEVVVVHPVLGRVPRTFQGVTLDADASAGPELAWLEVERGALFLEEAEFSLVGRVEDLLEPVRQVDLELRADGLDVPRFLTFLPPEMTDELPGRPEGVLDVLATLRGPLGVEVRPELRGTVSLRGGGLQTPEGVAVAEGVVGRIDLFNDSLSVRELEGRALDGPFTMSAAVHADSLLPFRADVRAAPRMERVGLVVELPPGTELAGQVDAALSIRGLAMDMGALAMDGTVDLRDFRGTFPDVAVPVGVGAGRFNLAGRNVSWQGVEVTLGSDRLVTGGTIRDYLVHVTGPEGDVPHITASVHAPRLNLDQIFPPEGDRDVTYGQVAFAHLGGRTLNGQSASEVARAKGFERPESLPASGELTLRVDTLYSEPFRLLAVDARVAFAPDLLQVTEARAGIFGGRLRTDMVVGLGEEEEQPFAFTLGVESVQAADFLAATSPLGRYIQGLLGLELEATGSVNRQLLPLASALGGAGRIQVSDGQILEAPITASLARSLARPALANPRFQDLAGRFRVEGASLIFEESLLALGTQEGELRYGGLIGLDGGLNLALRVAVPAARLDSDALAGTGFLEALAGRVVPREGPVYLGIRVGGTLTQPRLSPEGSLAVADVRQALEAEARERVQEVQAEGARRLQEAQDTVRAQVDAARDTAAARLEEERRRAEERAQEQLQRELEERGRGLLRRLRPDPTPPPDTVRPDTIPPDTIQPDTIPPDTIRRDTIPRDTIRPDTSRVDSGGSIFRL